AGAAVPDDGDVADACDLFGSHAVLRLLIASVDQPETVERQELVDGFDGARLGREQRAVAAGRDDACARGDLAANAIDQPVDERDVAVDAPRLDRVHGRLADDLRRLHELDLRELRRLRAERVERDADAGRDHAAEILALLRYAVERRRGAEVDDDARVL